ncbi:MAG: ATP-binding protein [Bdellovibrionales bacterium]|nr:ATP-binding protein [Bdellovibrionales bacterium]
MDFIHFAGEIMGILSPEIQAQILTLHYLEKMKDQDRDLISKYLRQWISKEKSERHSSMIQSKITTAKLRRVQTVENYDFRHSKTTEKIEKTYLALHAGIAKDNLPSAVFTGHAGTGKTHLARALGLPEGLVSFVFNGGGDGESSSACTEDL